MVSVVNYRSEKIYRHSDFSERSNPAGEDLDTGRISGLLNGGFFEHGRADRAMNWKD
jgi:hypothetical protein